MNEVCKAVLRIDCADTTKEDNALTQNAAARAALTQGGTGGAAHQDKREITVQYNPTSIKYHAGMSESSKVKYEKNGKNNHKITPITGEGTVNMSFTLVFHSRFAGDSSVQDQIEMILDMIRNSPAKQVEFSWANIHIEGRLVSFSGEYDMFDRSGMPVSGHMDMTVETSAKVEKTSKTLQSFDDSIPSGAVTKLPGHRNGG